MHLTSSLPHDSDVGGHTRVNVLLVDDRPENLLALEAILDPLDENLVRATSGEEALARLLTDEFALVLLDVTMPGMDGFETARRIKGRRKSAATPIIFLTANNPDERLILRGYETGAADYLFKPLTPEIVRSKVGVFCDLYRHKQLSDVLERISDAFFALDDEWRFSYVNEKAGLLLHRKRKELLGKVIWDEFPEIVGSTFGDQYQLAVESQTSVAFADYYAPFDSWFEVHAYPSREGLSVYFEDVSDKQRAQRMLRESLQDAVDARQYAERAQKDAEAANRLKSEFLATMSHEFRTPLNAILGYTQLIDMGVLGVVTPQQREHLERLRASGLHLLGLVNDILDLSKIEANRVRIARETGVVSDAIRDALALVGPQAAARGIDYAEECEGASTTSYAGDPDRVRQILVNLLSNAVKFTAPGGKVILHCGTAEHTDPGVPLEGQGPCTFVSVTDTGIGVPSEQMVRIFEPFVQAKTGYTRSEGGTGLGLAISRRLARLMGGDITVQSRVGEGSTFTLWLRSGYI